MLGKSRFSINGNHNISTTLNKKLIRSGCLGNMREKNGYSDLSLNNDSVKINDRYEV